MTARVADLGGRPPNKFAADSQETAAFVFSMGGVSSLLMESLLIAAPRSRGLDDDWVLDPPGVEAVVAVLTTDLAVPELEPDRQVGAHLGIRG
jgi:hypothetical protein